LKALVVSLNLMRKEAAMKSVGQPVEDQLQPRVIDGAAAPDMKRLPKTQS
jgi:hypothetical protein